MTKRIVLLLAVVLTAVVVYAEDFTVNGIKYKGDETTMTATVTGTEDGFNQTDVVIPETVNGYTVTRIGTNAFYRKLSIVTFTMPNSVTAIDVQSFQTCRNLEKVTFSANLTSIAYGAFISCKKLKEAKLPNSVVSIGESAFEGSGLMSFIFPEKIKEIPQRM